MVKCTTIQGMMESCLVAMYPRRMPTRKVRMPWAMFSWAREKNRALMKMPKRWLTRDMTFRKKPRYSSSSVMGATRQVLRIMAASCNLLPDRLKSGV